jgi:hypothetical protein
MVALGAAAWSVASGASDSGRVEISNGQIRVRLHLPDASHGFYRGTRFDWSGVFSSLQFNGHEFYGQWFDAVDPGVRDFTYDGPRIVAGRCTAITGPAEEFQLPLGFTEAKPGGTFVKIGVGVLRRPDETAYSAFRLYELVDPGRWTVRSAASWVEFTHELHAPGSEYAYRYTKTVRLTPGKAQMVLEHSLRNTGRLPIRSNVYGHNFLYLDRQAPGPDFEVTFPFEVKAPARPPDPSLARVEGRRFVYLKPLQGQDRVSASIEGFGGNPSDYDFRIANRRIGAGVRITGDRPLSRVALWSIRTVLAIEPFIDLAIEPGAEFSWSVSYDYQ